MRRRIGKEILSWAIWISLGIALAMFLNSRVLVNAHVLTGSMEGTIMASSRVFGLRTSFIFDTPHRGDIIVFDSPLPQEYAEPFIKRVIALPGEEIKVYGGIVHIDGQAILESYVDQEMQRDFEPFVVPEGAVFVMGDNRNHSRDSRDWGAVCKSTIIGRIYLDFSPLPAFIGGYSY